MQRSRFMKLYFNNAFSIIKEDQHYFLFEKKDQKKTTINEDMFHLLNEIQKLVKSRLLCKMLYNVFTISTYQN